MTSRFLQSKRPSATVPPAPRADLSSGRPLPTALRSEFGPRFQHDFSRVRVHSDDAAAAGARAAGVAAYTVGNDVVLGRGAFDAESAAGRRLVAHELAHVAQGRLGGSPASVDEAEQEAHRAGESAAAGRAAPVRLAVPAGRPLMAPPELAQPTLPNLGWRPPDLDTKSYTLADFDTGQAELKKAHRDTIDEVVKALARDPLLGGFVTVVGYADAIGPNPENKVLGQQRADAVRSELVDKGVSVDDVRAYSLGEEVLAVDTPKAEPKNRRVEIVVRRRRMRFGLTRPSRGTTIGPGKGGPGSQGGTWQPGPQEGGRPGVRPEFERRIRELAEGKGAAKGTAFDEAVDFLARNATKDLANDVADIAQALGFDRKKAKEMVEQGIKKGIEAGLKEALSKLLEALAGPQSARPPLETGPPVFELPKPSTVPIPLPFPGDEPKAANVNNATLRIDEKLSGNLTKIRYKPGEFVTFTFTTPESFGQLRTVAEIVPAGGGAALRSLDVRGRRSGKEQLAVPDSPGSYVLQVRIFGEEAHPRASFRFSVE